jgi:hypothetical protein
MLMKLDWTIGGRRLESFAVLACISELEDCTDHSLPQMASRVINFLQLLFLGWLGGNAMSITQRVSQPLGTGKPLGQSPRLRQRRAPDILVFGLESLLTSNRLENSPCRQ